MNNKSSFGKQILPILILSILVVLLIILYGHWSIGGKSYILNGQSIPHKRIFCFIPIQSRNLQKRAPTLKKTWLSKCDGYMFFGETDDKNLPMIKLPVKDSYKYLPAKTMAAFKYIHKNIFNYDYYLKADDDTYIIIENLRYLLSFYDDNIPLYIGHHITRHVKQGYISGGGSYVLNKEAINILMKGLNSEYNECHKSQGAEDATLGRCLERFGVKIALSKDITNRETFHPFSLQTYIVGVFPDWYLEYKQEPKNVEECCGEFSISFHFIEPIEMETYHFLIYNLQVYGLIKGYPKEPIYKARYLA